MSNYWIGTFCAGTAGDFTTSCTKRYTWRDKPRAKHLSTMLFNNWYFGDSLPALCSGPPTCPPSPRFRPPWGSSSYEYIRIFGNFLCISNFGRRFQDKSEKVGKERQLKPGTKALHKRSNQGLVQINCLKNLHDFWRRRKDGGPAGRDKGRKSRKDRLRRTLIDRKVSNTANNGNQWKWQVRKQIQNVSEKFSSNTKIHFQLAGQTLLHGFRRELPKPFFAVLPDLERKSCKGI